ncbi:helix-turn-helix domain-containing protein [Parvibium lacunae]|uniref:Putative Fis-like DNA-binding protein n=1 Tax=Parvibium lacunae TaxID=1888893 RepID=A0A368L4E9_9BURK|nr:helix-turn-helix domain-containing protein [Parvibium lacunae]RCS58395.1 Fis family transcriptional regulator [Parvibium lacunae]
MSTNNIATSITEALEQYFRDLGGEKPHNVYDMMVDAMEKPLLEFIMARTRHNQSQASIILGINRNTLRKKLQHHGML